MKKVLFFAASLVVTGLLLTSCGSTQECPAYGQADNGGVEMPQQLS